MKRLKHILFISTLLMLSVTPPLYALSDREERDFIKKVEQMNPIQKTLVLVTHSAGAVVACPLAAGITLTHGVLQTTVPFTWVATGITTLMDEDFKWGDHPFHKRKKSLGIRGPL